ncbi:transcriptional regulator, TetR family [Anaerocolumna jejuensis DSM 15929]|uniref:Transcriptional regulator, TetR family n=1 Tax=Anaerocolumna jejuensis DSM 15929 TaxID=1121322 RepID=A0A1M7BVL3_9FIRM|nr:TetR-like C-terminal domain-containing protein [Anaerocolumna jejuensis]SHL58906.1 transcriptional regulator, TetR family [Anaerocolumna jejuensis DSM 15929]
MKRKENQRIKLTKTLLKKSLIELMHTKSINKITVKELCENADINRSTFYLYYTDQFALLKEIEEELLLNAREHLKNIDSDLNNLHYLKELLYYMKTNSDIFYTLLCRQENLSFQTAFINTSILNLKINVNLQCEEKISDYIYRYLTMGCFSLITKWFEAGFDMSPEELAEMIFRLSDNAISVYDVSRG